MEQIPQQQSTWIRLRSIVGRWLITTLAIFAAVQIIPGIHFTGPGWELGIVALVFGLINTLLRPLLTLLTCSLIVLTLGLFSLVINALLLLLTAQIAGSFGVLFQVDSFWSAIGGGLVISIVTLVLSILTGETPVRVVVRNDNQQR